MSAKRQRLRLCGHCANRIHGVCEIWEMPVGYKTRACADRYIETRRSKADVRDRERAVWAAGMTAILLLAAGIGNTGCAVVDPVRALDEHDARMRRDEQLSPEWQQKTWEQLKPWAEKDLKVEAWNGLYRILAWTFGTGTIGGGGILLAKRVGNGRRASAANQGRAG